MDLEEGATLFPKLLMSSPVSFGLALSIQDGLAYSYNPYNGKRSKFIFTVQIFEVHFIFNEDALKCRTLTAY